jgi:histidine triad (HIT) family protein
VLDYGSTIPILQSTGSGIEGMRFLRFFTHTKIGRLLIGWIFAHMSFILPIKRLHETETLLVFNHPEPSYPVHILLVPKKAIGSLVDLNEGDNEFLHDVFRTAKSLVEELEISQTGYRLILNGGEYQEVPQLHFHLVSGISNPQKLIKDS